MAATTHPEIRFRIDGDERDQAEKIAARIGLNLNDAMKIMLKRFIVEGGLPFDMRQADRSHVSVRSIPVHGVTLATISEIASTAAREAALVHRQTGRLPALEIKDEDEDANTHVR